MDVHAALLVFAAFIGFSSSHRRNGNIMTQQEMPSLRRYDLSGARMMAALVPGGGMNRFFILTQEPIPGNNINLFSSGQLKQVSRRRNRAKASVRVHDNIDRGVMRQTRLGQSNSIRRTPAKNVRPFRKSERSRGRRFMTKELSNNAPRSSTRNRMHSDRKSLRQGNQRKVNRRSNTAKHRIKNKSTGGRPVTTAQGNLKTRVPNHSRLHLKAPSSIINGRTRNRVRNYVNNMKQNRLRQSDQASAIRSAVKPAAIKTQKQQSKTGSSVKTPSIRNQNTAMDYNLGNRMNSYNNKERNIIKTLNMASHQLQVSDQPSVSYRKNSANSVPINKTTPTADSLKVSLQQIQKQINLLMKQLNAKQNNDISVGQYVHDNQRRLQTHTAVKADTADKQMVPTALDKTRPSSRQSVHAKKQAKMSRKLPKEQKPSSASITMTTQDPEALLEEPVTKTPPASKMTELIFQQPGSKPIKLSFQRGTKITHIRQNGSSKLLLQPKSVTSAAKKTTVTTEEPPEIEAP